jgi:hypothetical protein
MAKHHAISADLARQLLDYDPDAGVLRWKPRTPDMFGKSTRFSADTQCRQWNGRHAGTVAGSRTKKGYLHVQLNGEIYSGHHLMWLIHTGEHAPHEIDHRDGDTGNNKFFNFRPAGPGENAQNRKLNRNNTSGITGVAWIEKSKKWKVIFRRKYLGLFDTSEEAEAVYLSEKRRCHQFQPHPRYLPEIDVVLSDDTKSRMFYPGKKKVMPRSACDKMRQIRLGTKHTAETRAKMSATHKERLAKIRGES